MSDDAARAELPLGWLPILRAVVDSPTWWITRRDLGYQLEMSRRDGAPNAALRARLDLMLETKWLDPWEHEQRAAVTLSTRAAASLGVRLTQPEDANKEPRWTDTKTVRWPRANAQRDFAQIELEAFDRLFDPQPLPDEHAAELEEFQREASAARRELAAGDGSRADRLLRRRPRVFLTGCELVWWEQIVERGHEFRERPFCPVCCADPIVDARGDVVDWTPVPMRDGVVCGRCFRWCLDEYFRWKLERRAA